MKEKEEIVYVTKYALTTGVIKTNGTVSTYFPEMVECHALGVFATFHGDEWYRSEEAAQARAQEMVKKKIASVEKQLARLKKINYVKVVEKFVVIERIEH